MKKINLNTIIVLCLSLFFSMNLFAETKIPAPELDKPENRTLVHTSTPTFTWKRTSDPDIEYRIMIAEWTGKSILDEWVGHTDHFQVTKPDLLTDLGIYLWTVSAYKKQEFVQSETFSFCIDLNISLDLEIVNVKLLTPKQNWRAHQKVDLEVQVLNCGPVPCYDAVVQLGTGNLNPNYLTPNSFQPSEIIDSAEIKELKSGQSKKIKLTGFLKPGFNHFYAEVTTKEGYVDIFQSNNTKAGPSIQTVGRKLQLNGLFVIYDKIHNSQQVLKTISSERLSEIYEAIEKIKKFYWKHTHIIQLTADTLIMSHPLTHNDLTYIDQKWGFVLKPEKIEKDLRLSAFRENEFDFVYVFYPWTNTVHAWSGYHGYSYGNANTILGNTHFSAQPIVENTPIRHEIGIHEIMHVLDNSFEKQGISRFYSPDDQAQVTTFANHLDYLEWILETWPTNEWFKLNKGKLVITNEDVALLNQQLKPSDLILHQNYPNPFNSSTMISYELESRTNSFVYIELAIYNLLGVRVRSLVNENQKSGQYSVRWNGLDDSGQPVSTGIYFYSVKAGNQILLNKLLYIK